MSDLDRQRADRKLEQLLAHVPPVLSMPEADKERVLGALLARADEGPAEPWPAERRMPGRFVALAAAAAAAALIGAALVLLWSGGGADRLAWADVAEQLGAIRTLGGSFVKTTVATDGRSRTLTGRLYYKDPGMIRYDHHEEIDTDVDGGTRRVTPPDALYIHRVFAQGSVLLQIFPARREAIRSEIDTTGTLLGPWRERQLNPALFGWSKLQAVSAGATRDLGRREVAGQAAVGFAASMTEILGPQPLGIDPDGEIRVWASVESAVPLSVELERRLENGWAETVVIEPLEWNIPVADSLFDDSVVEGYEVFERRVHNRGFPRPTLRPHVTLRLGPEAGGPVVNELDVLGAVMGTVSFEPWRLRQYHTWITFELTAEASERLRTYLGEHEETPLWVDFNGEFNELWKSRAVASRLIRVEVTPLRKRLIDFEIEYLVEPEPTDAAD